MMSTKNSTEFDSYSERKAFDETKAGVKGLVDAQITEVPRIFHVPPDALAEKKPSPDFKIPIIDFAGVQVDSVSHEAIVEKVRYAAEKWGFFQVINHGVPLSVLENIKDGVRRFHEEDVEVKKSYFTRDFTKTFIYTNNFDLYSSSSAVYWRDTFICYMAPHPPNPKELPVACSTLSNHGSHELQHILPKGTWLRFDFEDSHPDLPTLYLHGGSIIPLAPPRLHVGEFCLSDDLTLLVSLDKNGKAKGLLFEDDGDGYGYTKMDF